MVEDALNVQAERGREQALETVGSVDIQTSLFREIANRRYVFGKNLKIIINRNVFRGGNISILKKMRGRGGCQVAHVSREGVL